MVYTALCPLNWKGVSKQLLPKLLPGGQMYAPGSTKLLFTELTPLEPPTCPPDQLLAWVGAARCGAGRWGAARSGAATRCRLGLVGGSSATAGCTIASAEIKPMQEMKVLFMTRPPLSEYPNGA